MRINQCWMIGLIFCLLLFLCSGQAEVQSGFLSKESFAYGGKALAYWLYTPKNAESEMPLVVYLHGGSRKGDDLELLMAQEGLPQYLRDGLIDVPAYVIMPQVGADVKDWQSVSDSVFALIDSVVEQYAIDRGDISLTGHSMGGIGTWALAAQCPERFARIAPMSGNPSSISKKLAGISMPVWSIVGSGTSDARAYEGNARYIPMLQESNDAVTLTVMDGAEHRHIVNAYWQYDIISWLIGNESTPSSVENNDTTRIQGDRSW